MSPHLPILREVFGYDAFRGPQQAIIDHVAAGGDALVLMPTGGGKSLCYQVPALCREGLAVVISPLIALMQDQVEALQQAGVAAAAQGVKACLANLREISPYDFAVSVVDFFIHQAAECLEICLACFEVI